MGRLLALTAAYVVTGRLGLALSPMSSFASLIWPPAGLALVALVLGGLRLWPGVAAGAVLVNLWMGAPPLAALGIGVGSTLGAVGGAHALRRIPGFRGSLTRFVEVVSLVVLAGVASTFVSATLGTACIALGGIVAPGDLVRTWSVWWTGDAMSDIVLAPLLLTWARGPRVDARPATIAEAALLGVSLLGASLLVFAQDPGVEGPFFRPSVLFVLAIWAALRFRTRGAATLAFVVAVIALWGTYTGYGPFARTSTTEGLLAVHAFLLSLSLSSLALGAVVAELRASRAALRESVERERAALAEAQAAARAKDTFLAVLSHELRTPLQAMLGWTEMLRPRAHDAHLVERGLATIERSAAAQQRLIEDLLDVSRIVAGTLRIERTRVDLGRVVAEAVESARSAASAKSIRLDAALAPLAGEVLGDPDRLQQIVANLIANSVKFTPCGGRIGVRLDPGGTTARIVVEDTGCGISPALLPHVFDRFRQGENGTTRRQGGLGLGLAIVRHLVELHGGSVTAESRGEGRGAMFTVTLPVVDAEPGAALAASERAAAPLPAVLEGVRVLVVDDDGDACDLLDMALRAAGASVHAVRTVRAAVGELASFRPDLLLSDIGMPGEDGYALIREVRARQAEGGARIPAIALSAFASSADRDQALANGFDAHLAKPANAGDLARLMASLLRRAPA